MEEHKLPARIYLNILQQPGIIKVLAKLYQFNGFATCIREKSCPLLPLTSRLFQLLFLASGCTRTVSDSENVSTAVEKRQTLRGAEQGGKVGAVISVIMQISVFCGCCLIYKLDETTWLFRARTLLPRAVSERPDRPAGKYLLYGLRN